MHPFGKILDAPASRRRARAAALGPRPPQARRSRFERSDPIRVVREGACASDRARAGRRAFRPAPCRAKPRRSPCRAGTRRFRRERRRSARNRRLRAGGRRGKKQPQGENDACHPRLRPKHRSARLWRKRACRRRLAFYPWLERCPEPIYKICPRALWREAETAGRFDGAPVDLADGFIHFSTAAQVRETAARHFSGDDGSRARHGRRRRARGARSASSLARRRAFPASLREPAAFGRARRHAPAARTRRRPRLSRGAFHDDRRSATQALQAAGAGARAPARDQGGALAHDPPPAVTADPRLAVNVLGLDFPNPIGLAAGLDKDAKVRGRDARHGLRLRRDRDADAAAAGGQSAAAALPACRGPRAHQPARLQQRGPRGRARPA